MGLIDTYIIIIGLRPIAFRGRWVVAGVFFWKSVFPGNEERLWMMCMMRGLHIWLMHCIAVVLRGPG